MKTIGLLGGLSWESSKEYYRLINEAVKERLGGVNSAKIVLYSVNFAEVMELQHAGDWAGMTDLLVDAARRVQAGGADFLLLCTNTMHKMADQIQAGISIPFLHIADAAAAQIKAHGLTRVGLLGTRVTMEENFYKDRLSSLHGLEVLVPSDDDRQIINQVIYEELIQGTILESSRREYLRIINELAQKGAQGIILGCTEIGLLVRPQDTSLLLFDTTEIHARSAVDMALS